MAHHGRAGKNSLPTGNAPKTAPDVMTDVGDGIRSFLARKGLSSPEDLRGKVQLGRRAPEPAYRSG